MSKQHLRIFVLAVFIILALSVTACTRSASTPPPSEVSATPEVISDTQATMDAVRSSILTQTAAAEEAGEPTATEEIEETAEAEEGTGTPAAVTPEVTPTTMGVTEYTVQSGDWIWKIARNFGVDPQDIIELNDLSSPGQIQPGMVLKIPVPSVAAATATPISGTPQAGGTTHIVKPGEWIWQIARIYGVDPQAIIDANNLTNASNIYPGQELVIP